MRNGLARLRRLATEIAEARLRTIAGGSDSGRQATCLSARQHDRRFARNSARQSPCVSAFCFIPTTPWSGTSSLLTNSNLAAPSRWRRSGLPVPLAPHWRGNGLVSPSSSDVRPRDSVQTATPTSTLRFSSRLLDSIYRPDVLPGLAPDARPSLAPDARPGWAPASPLVSPLVSATSPLLVGASLPGLAYSARLFSTPLPASFARRCFLSSTALSADEGDAAEKRPGIGKRFKNAYKNYGKVLIVFHCVTYCMWFATGFTISWTGLDVVPVLQYLHDHLGLSQSVIDHLSHSGAGHFAVAFILCKIISPIRYLTTIVGTKYAADFLRRRGWIAPIPAGDSIGDLAKESSNIIKTQVSRKSKKIKKVNTFRYKRTVSKVKSKLKPKMPRK